MIVVVFFLFYLFHKAFSRYASTEDAQQILFPVVLVAFFFLSRVVNINIPTHIYFVSLSLWVLLLFRVECMDSRGFFTGRVVIGRLQDDPYGLEGRSLFRSLQKIARTYNLPGPALLPLYDSLPTISPRDSELKIARHRLRYSVPALEIYGSTKQYLLKLNQISHSDMSGCAQHTAPDLCESEEIEKERILFIPSPVWPSEYLAISSYPSIVKIQSAPHYTKQHYIEWLSAYLSSEISTKPEIRFDVLYEAAALEGLEVQSPERVFVKILLSYEEILSFVSDGSAYHIVSAKERLAELLYLVKKIKNPELHGFAYNLYAISLIYVDSSEAALESAKKTLSYVESAKDISRFQRRIASHNLSVLSLGTEHRQ